MRRRSPLKRGKGLRRKKRIARVSARRRAQNEVRKRVLEEMRGKVEHCQAGAAITAYDETHACQWYVSDGHELVRRSQGGSIVDPENILLLCRACHEYVTRNPAVAVELGLARWAMRENPDRNGEVSSAKEEMRHA